MQLSTRTKVAIVFCAACAMVVAVTVHLRAVAYSDSGTSPVTKSTGQADESAFAFNLDIHLATEVPEEPSKIPDGHTLMRKDDRLFLAQTEPVLTEGDLRDVRIRRVPATGDEDNRQTSVVAFQLTEAAAATLASITEQNIGKHLIIVLNDEVLATPRIRDRITGGVFQMPAEGLSEHQGEMLFMYPMLPFMRAMTAAGVWETLMDDAPRMDRDPAGALELYEKTLRKLQDNAYLALWVRGWTVRCHARIGDIPGAVTAATEALPDAMKVLRTPDATAYWFGTEPFEAIASALVMWKEDASHEELAQAQALAEAATRRASAMVRRQQEDGNEHGAAQYQSMARSGKICAARAKARLGDAATAEAELRKIMEEDVPPMARTKYYLAKTLIESGTPRDAAKLLQHAWCHLAHHPPQWESPAYKWQRADIKRLLAELGETVDEGPPQIIPGAGKIIVQARFGDGGKPLGAKCYLASWSQREVPTPRWARDAAGVPVPRKVVGADGDWVIYNVPEGSWAVGVSRADFPPIYARVNRPERVEVEGGEESSVTLTLVRGGSVTGRVVYADTGKPASAITVRARQPSEPAETDAAGRYTIDHLAAGQAEVSVYAEHSVPVHAKSIEVNGGATVTVPDIRLHRGGWVSGRVVAPQDAHLHGSHLSGSVTPHFDGELPAGVSVGTGRIDVRKDFEFRVGPLLPGSYSLEAKLQVRRKPVELQWAGGVTGVQVKVGEETQDVVIEVTEVEE